ncbi:hypothetical protein ABWH98_07600 [Labrenzia sp. ac12]
MLLSIRKFITFLFMMIFFCPPVLASDYAFSGKGYIYLYSTNQGLVDDGVPWKKSSTKLTSAGDGAHRLEFGNCVFEIQTGFAGVHPGLVEFVQSFTKAAVSPKALPATFAGSAKVIGRSSITDGANLPIPCANTDGGIAIAIIPVKEGVSFKPNAAPKSHGKEVMIIFYSMKNVRDVNQIMIPLSQDFFRPSEKELAKDIFMVGLAAALDHLLSK